MSLALTGFVAVALAGAPAPAAPRVTTVRAPAPDLLRGALPDPAKLDEDWPPHSPPRALVVAALCDGDAAVLDEVEVLARRLAPPAQGETWDDVVRPVRDLLPGCCRALDRAMAVRRARATGVLAALYSPQPDDADCAAGSYGSPLRPAELPWWGWAAAPPDELWAQLPRDDCATATTSLEYLAGRDWAGTRKVVLGEPLSALASPVCRRELVAVFRAFSSEDGLRAWLQRNGFPAPPRERHVVSVRGALAASNRLWSVDFEDAPGLPPDHLPFLVDLSRLAVPELKGALFQQLSPTLGCSGPPQETVTLNGWFKGFKSTVTATYERLAWCPQPGRPRYDGPESSGVDARASVTLVNELLARSGSATRLWEVQPSGGVVPGESVVQLAVGTKAELSAAFAAGFLSPWRPLDDEAE